MNERLTPERLIKGVYWVVCKHQPYRRDLARKYKRESWSDADRKQMGMLLTHGNLGDRVKVSPQRVLEVILWLGNDAPDNGRFCWSRVITSVVSLRRNWDKVQQAMHTWKVEQERGPKRTMLGQPMSRRSDAGRDERNQL